MRIVILLLIAVGLVFSGWYMWQAATAPAETYERPVVRADAPAPAHPAAKPAAPPAPAPSAPPPKPAPAAKAIEPTVTMTVRHIPTEDDKARLLMAEAEDAFNSGDYHTSLRLFTDALPHDSAAHTGAGLSHFKLGDFRAAVRELKRSVDENGPEFKALKFLALAHYKLDELDKSEPYALQALALEKDTELRAFYEKLKREQSALVNRVDESNLHFKVVFDGYEHGSISRLILDVLDSAYRDIGREFGHFPDRSITVVLYTERDFFDVTRAPAWAGGLFDGKIRVPVKGAESVDRELLRIVLYHEYVHAMVHDLAQDVPRWVHEGLAEYLVPRGMERIAQVIPFQSLEGAFFSRNPRIVLTAYEESYSAIARLVDRYSMYDVKQFILSLGQSVPVERAFQDTFYLTYNEFAASWETQ